MEYISKTKERTPLWMGLKHLERLSSLGALLTHEVLGPQGNADVSLPLFPLNLSKESSVPEPVLGGTARSALGHALPLYL